MKQKTVLITIGIGVVALSGISVVLLVCSAGPSRTSDIGANTESNPALGASNATNHSRGGHDTCTAYDANGEFLRLFGGTQLRIPVDSTGVAVSTEQWESSVKEISTRVALKITIHHSEWVLSIVDAQDAYGERDYLSEYLRGVIGIYMRGRSRWNVPDGEVYRSHRRELLAKLTKTGVKESVAEDCLARAGMSLLDQSCEDRLYELARTSEADLEGLGNPIGIARKMLLLEYKAGYGGCPTTLHDMPLADGSTIVLASDEHDRDRGYGVFVFESNGELRCQGTFNEKGRGSRPAPVHLVAWLLGY